MADSDDEYVQELSGNEDGATPGQQTNGYGTRSEARQTGGRAKERWEDVQRSWDEVTEGADGSLARTVGGLLEAGKRRKLLRDTIPVQRGVIRNLVLLIDLSSAMAEKDFRPNRYTLVLRFVIDFVQKFFEQNPISQLAILGMRDGLAIKISDLTGNTTSHVSALQKKLEEVMGADTEAGLTGAKSLADLPGPRGSPSLQNGLDLARAHLKSVPSPGTREVLVIFGAIMTADPGDIHQTIRNLVTDRIRVCVIGIAARIAICSQLVSKTNGLASLNAASSEPDTTSSTSPDTLYGVCLDEKHFRELLMIHTIPPATRAEEQEANPPKLLPMGFPSRVDEDHETLCACHAQASRGGYFCTRCQAKVCALPAACPTCGLQLVQSTHLARSYHHLFPLKNFEEVTWEDARSAECSMCMNEFPPVPADGEKRSAAPGKGASESSRYACTSCGEHYCIDCDIYMHEVLHNCPGCLESG